MKFVVHFVGDMHQPLHDEDNGDRGGNDCHVILDGHPDNLHRVWDTGLLEQIKRSPEALAAELGSRITPQDRAEWTKGTIEDWGDGGSPLGADRGLHETWAVRIPPRSRPPISGRRAR